MSAVTAASVTADLLAEQESLDSVVRELTDEQWDSPTPSPRWAVRDQIGHLAFFDGTAALAITDPEAFQTHAKGFVAAAFRDANAADTATLETSRALASAELLAHWRANRALLASAAAQCAGHDRIEWYGPSMGSKSFLTARLMECWAHGQDICDALGVRRDPTDRIRHIAQLGYITRGWTYINRKEPVPEGEVHVGLRSPSGETWVWGPASGEPADASIIGTALDFCLVTAQRRNVADTDLEVNGELAHDWLSKAQLFAGPPSDPPRATD